MDRGKQLHRAGLLIFILLAFFFTTGLLFAQEGEEIMAEPPVVVIPFTHRIEMSNETPMVNSSWSLYILVNHPDPREVIVRPPRFPPALALDRVRTETRYMRSTSGREDERWTRIEFLFTPIRAGAITITPFEITVLGRRVETRSTNVRILPQTVTRNYNPRFNWQSQQQNLPSAASPAESGKKNEFILELTNWNPQLDAPRNIFQGRAPRNAIIEESIPQGTGDGIFRYTVYVIPLEESNVTLESFIFRTDIYAITVPAINIPVMRSATDAAASIGTSLYINPGVSSLEEENAVLKNRIPFPENSYRRVRFFEAEYRRICARVQDLWEQGLIAEALAEIRKNERDSLAGRSLVTLRRDMELALGLGFTRDEKWFPPRIPVVSWVILVFLIFAAASVFLVFYSRLRRKTVSQKSVTFHRRGGFKAVIIFVFLLGFAFIFLEEGFRNLPIGRSRSPARSAVLRETQAYRVPDDKGAINARFSEGQPVLVGDRSPEWCSAETPDGRSGWVKREAVILY